MDNGKRRQKKGLKTHLGCLIYNDPHKSRECPRKKKLDFARRITEMSDEKDDM